MGKLRSAAAGAVLLVGSAAGAEAQIDFCVTSRSPPCFREEAYAALLELPLADRVPIAIRLGTAWTAVGDTAGRGAFSIAETSASMGDTPELLAEVAIAQADAGYDDDAFATLMFFPPGFDRNRALLALVKADAAAADVAGAQAQAAEIADTPPPAGQASGWRSFAAEAWSAVASAQARAGDAAAAQESARRAREAAFQLPDELVGHSPSLVDVAVALVDSGDFAGALAVIDALEAPDLRQLAIRSVFAAADARGIDTAARLNAYGPGPERASALTGIALGHIGRGEFTPAGDSLAAASADAAGAEPGVGLTLLMGIAEAQRAMGDATALRRTLAEAVALAKLDDDPASRAGSLVAIAELDAETAPARLDLALTAARSIADEVLRSETGKAVALAHVAAGEVETAGLLAAEFAAPEVLAAVAAQQARAGDVAAAAATATAIADPGERAIALGAIASATYAASAAELAYPLTGELIAKFIAVVPDLLALIERYGVGLDGPEPFAPLLAAGGGPELAALAGAAGFADPMEILLVSDAALGTYRFLTDPSWYVLFGDLQPPAVNVTVVTANFAALTAFMSGP